VAVTATPDGKSAPVMKLCSGSSPLSFARPIAFLPTMVQ
jgi:hypothetical protein